MSKNLYCPECSVEYWGESHPYAKCDNCNYVFTERDILETASLESLIIELKKMRSGRLGFRGIAIEKKEATK